MSKKILLIGAGKSTSSLIKYLAEHASTEKFKLVVADKNLKTAQEAAEGFNDFIEAISLDVTNSDKRAEAIQSHDLIISMLPAFMHLEVAKDCVRFKKNMVTASYISEEIKALDKEAKKSGIVLMNEIGLDPGIDHLSAMKIIDYLKSENLKIMGFETYTGGLVSPEYDNNPWNYKFTWNPRNVVVSGLGVAKYIHNYQYKYIPYHQIFRRASLVEIDDFDTFESYPNRDSLKYREIYGIEEVPTLIRGTLRRKGFSRAWNLFVSLGVTDDSFKIKIREGMTYRDFINSFLPYNLYDSVEIKFKHYFNIQDDDFELFEKFEWLGIFSNEKISLKSEATPAQIMLEILEKKWRLEAKDRDMIVMLHKFNFEKNNQLHQITSSMVIKGENQKHTAMAKTVGLPLAIVSKMILKNQIKLKGVQLPVDSSVYIPVLKELEEHNIRFKEKTVVLNEKKYY